jgi:YVTN family beta-propeller protein
MMMDDNMARGHELSYMAFSPADNSALVTDENDDVVRVVSLDSNTTTATITLPSGSQAHAIAVNDAGTMAAVSLSAKASVALIDLSQKTVLAVIGTGYYPSHLAFSGSDLLVSNEASGTVSVIDTSTRAVLQNVTVGAGPAGIAAAPGMAVVANMQAGTLSLISLADYSVSNIALPAGSLPYEVGMSASANKALITTPMSDSFLILDLGTKAVTAVDTSVWNAMGPGAIAINGNVAFIANMMTASVTAVDLTAGKVLKTFQVDPGPRALAVDAAKNRLLVLAEGTGTLDVVDLSSYTITTRLNAADTERQGDWNLPLISSINPNTASVGSSFTLAITGANLQAVKGIEFYTAGAGSGMGGGGMMGGSYGQGPGGDSNIQVSNIQVSADGTQVTASVQILSSAVPGTRLVQIETNEGEIMGMMSGSLFTVTQ